MVGSAWRHAFLDIGIIDEVQTFTLILLKFIIILVNSENFANWCFTKHADFHTT